MDNARLAALLRKNSWGLDLLVIAVASFCVAHAANAVVAKVLRVLPSIHDPIPQAAGGGSEPGPRQPLTDLAERNLMKLRRESLAPAGAEAGARQAEGPQADLTLKKFREDELGPCSLNAVVRATLVADDPLHSLAVVVRNDTQMPAVYSLADGHDVIFDDAILVAVRSREIVVRRRDHFERCRGDGEGQSTGSPIAMAPQVADETPAAPGEIVGVHRLSATDYRVERAEVDRALSNLNEVATQARIVPNFKNGRANGFKMFAIKPGSIYAKIGLQNGDVIQKINGYDMNSPDRALEIYTKLRDASSLSIELGRGSQTLTMNYAIH